MNSYIPWMKINEFLLDVETVRNPKDFCIQAIKSIYPLIPYDQARLYFVDETGLVYDEVLFGVEKRWSDIYLDYFSKIQNGRYSIPNKIEHEFNGFPSKIEPGVYFIPRLNGGLYDWSKCERDEFVADYIAPQGIRYSIGSGFRNANNSTITIYSLDRTSRCKFSLREMDILNIIQPHVINLHRSFFAYKTDRSAYTIHRGEEELLTRREAEIAALLCDGVTPNNISKKLVISVPTVYRHIANIHSKLKVTNRQELILKLMSLRAQ
jgi:DNA-binding CsgD family transcriptional regulator